MELIHHVGLVKIVVNVGPYYPQFVRELIANLPTSFNDPSSPDYQKVHEKSVCFSISPAIINSFLDLLTPLLLAMPIP